MVDTAHPHLRPPRDPPRGLMFSALERPIRNVTIDVAAAGLDVGRWRAPTGAAERDRASRDAEETFSLSLRLVPQAPGP